MPNTFSFTRIIHPTDYSLASEFAFAHALKLAVIGKSDLRIIHFVEPGVVGSWDYFPKVQETLVRWGMLTPNSTKEQMNSLGLRVDGVLTTGPDMIPSILRNLDRHPTNLIVLATHQIDGLNRWLVQPVAEPLARRSGLTTLFVPPVPNGFVAAEQGTVDLDRILIPVDHQPSPQKAVDTAFAWTQALAGNSGECRMLHVGSVGNMPQMHLPPHGNMKWKTIASAGHVVERILEEEKEFSPNLIIMVTQGHKGWLDILRGNTTERVLRGVRCPVLAIPAES